ncbi:ATP-binding protein [Ameyamaea chiangmaiensis]|nr:ATP-binding protein [Ameyamaea chiangmaiensis]
MSRASGQPAERAGGVLYAPHRTRLISPLMLRIMLLNILPLALLAVTLLFLDQFQNSLLEAEVTALREQAKIYAGALGQSAVVPVRLPRAARADGLDGWQLNAELGRPLLLRLTEPSPNARARVYAPDGQLIAQSETGRRLLPSPRGDVTAQPLGVPGDATRAGTAGTPAPGPVGDASQISAPGGDGAADPLASGTPLTPDPDDLPPGLSERVYDWLLGVLPGRRAGRIEMQDMSGTPPGVRPFDPADPASALAPVETPPDIRRTRNGHLVVTVVEPVRHDGRTIGVIQLTRRARDVDRSLFAVRSSILSLFLIALAITVFLSWYMSLTIARPLLRLVGATDVLRETGGRADIVPAPILRRRDEIGELARALRDSALALWARMDAIERFAADVSHEIKNPLSSIRSAIETLLRLEKNEAPRRLLTIIHDDVRRLDRLITDIADASRVDAELSRVRAEPVAVLPLLNVLAEIHQVTRKPGQPILIVDPAEEPGARPIRALAVEDRLVQVLRNLIGNAVSFSPPDGRIVVGAHVDNTMVELSVSDEGPGIPQAKITTIFDRFYSERPQSEHFGQHSGLGLSISRQIVEALRGTIGAENRIGPDGEILGARFVVRLPRAP